MSSELQKRLYHYEVTPPPVAWDKIASALDESHLADEFPATLYDLEATPPATAWQKIKAALGDNDETASPVRRIAPIWRYAAAAAVIAAIAFGSIRLLDSNKVEGEIAGGTTPATTTQTPVTTNNNNNEIVSVPVEETDPEQEARNDAALEESKKLFASLDESDKQRISRLSEEHFLSMADPISAAEDINPDNTYRDPQCTYINSPSFALNDDNSPIDMANRYVMLMTPDGHFIRISKKLGPLVCCVSGEEADEDCNNQMKKWREKLASPKGGISSGNFLELLHLINNFKENNP